MKESEPKLLHFRFRNEKIVWELHKEESAEEIRSLVFCDHVIFTKLFGIRAVFLSHLLRKMKTLPEGDIERVFLEKLLDSYQIE